MLKINRCVHCGNSWQPLWVPISHVIGLLAGFALFGYILHLSNEVRQERHLEHVAAITMISQCIEQSK